MVLPVITLVWKQLPRLQTGIAPESWITDDLGHKPNNFTIPTTHSTPQTPPFTPPQPPTETVPPVDVDTTASIVQFGETTSVQDTKSANVTSTRINTTSEANGAGPFHDYLLQNSLKFWVLLTIYMTAIAA